MRIITVVSLRAHYRNNRRGKKTGSGGRLGINNGPHSRWIAIGFRLYGTERGIDYKYDRKKNHHTLSKWRRQIDFFFKTVRSFARAIQIHLRLTPAVRVALEGRGCVPVNAEGFRGTRMEARRGLVTATGQEGHCRGHVACGVEARRLISVCWQGPEIKA